jgi:hypothetical protein
VENAGQSWIPCLLDENDGPPSWNPDPWDIHLPRKGGFIRDFVYATRGMETPTSFSCWNAIYLLSSVVRRDVWLKWFPKPLFGNLYVIMVAPPRICGKTTIASLTGKILREFPDEIQSPLIREMKTPRVIQNKATPEKLLELMKPKQTSVQNGSRIVTVEHGSQVSVIVPELETFLGKQKYNEGLIGLLMDIYDCHDIWEYNSMAHGTITLRDSYVSFLGGTTEDGLQMSINDAAFGQGFMSRVIIVYEPMSSREFPIPAPVEGAPTTKELCERLAWIASHHRGCFEFEPSALEVYKQWYHEFRKTLIGGGEKSKLLYRMDNTLLKLAMLIRCNRYEEGNIITLSDFEESLTILNATYRRSWEALDAVGGSEYHRHLRLAEAKIRDGTRVNRREVLTTIRWTNAKELTQAMNQLFQEGKIKIVLDGEQKNWASTNGREVYVWAVSA